MPRGRAKKKADMEKFAKKSNGANLGFETKLFLAADKLCGNLESRTFTQTRYLILPKLMSGEINIRDVEKAVKAVA